MATAKPIVLYTKQAMSRTHYTCLNRLQRPQKILDSLEQTSALYHDDRKTDFVLELIPFDANDLNAINAMLWQKKTNNKIVIIVDAKYDELRLLCEEHTNISYLLKNDHVETRLLSLFKKQHAYRATQAANDNIVEIPDEALFQQILTRTLARAKRYHRTSALLLLEISNLPLLIKEQGGDLGYQLAWEVSERLENTLRGNDVLYRIDLKCFAIVLEQINDPLECANVSRKLLSALQNNFNIDGLTLDVHCHIGIACNANAQTTDIKQHYSEAYLALQHLDGHNESAFRYFDETLQKHEKFQLEIVHDLQSAMKNHEFSLQYLPIVDLKRQQLQAVEVLLRWNHPSLDIIGTKSFIPLAEKAGIVNELMKWMLSELNSNTATWRNEYHPKLFIKLSPFLLLDEMFVSNLKTALQAQHIANETIVLEIREHCVMNDKVELETMFNNLDSLQCSVCIEDFGKGHLSVNDLRQHRIQFVKLSTDFTHDAISNPEHLTMIRALNAMASNLDIDVIASRVDSSDAFTFFAEEHCQLASGGHIGDAVDSSNVHTIISNRRLKLIQNS